jgi:membrane-associated phospholipid phosphatase
MFLSPTRFDVWVATLLAHFLGRHPLFDYCVQSGIRHEVFGGVAYAAALFVLWVHSRQREQETMRRRVLTILLGSLIAIQLTVFAGMVIAWYPPARHPSLALAYLQYIGGDPARNSFPSQSTALYAAVAAGVYSLHRVTGWLLWAGVFLLVALPRMYVGGHWASDILAGLLLGLTGYAAARDLLETTVVPHIDRLFEGGSGLQVLAEIVVFAWIFQVALEFRDAVWVRDSLKYFLGHAAG